MSIDCFSASALPRSESSDDFARPFLQIVGLWKAFRSGSDVLRGLTLHVGRGESVVLEGSTGAGKSVLFQLIIGAENADRGQIVVGGTIVCGRATLGLAAVRRSMGLMVHGTPLVSRLTIRENVELALRAVQATSRELRFRVYDVLKALGLEGRRDAYPDELSAGERQKVRLARALVTRPALLLADDPTMALDRTAVGEVAAVLRDAHALGMTIVAATSDPTFAARLGSRRLLLNGGILEEASRERT